MKKKGSDLLKAGRTIRGFTQDEVAQIYGISSKTYGSWERGRTAVSYDDLSAIFDQVFQLPLDKVTEVASHAA
ncbi:helix-turn-helix transcriptional regulator [Shewanella sp. YLB-07]|uniref:helix-turn-helix transcriptional regulator n=1 Tax=Shewanella sp. YLB-07 TaxID=2601268 RepID=UPI00128D6061|nr:helix-turn-helix transcriptional regulator [Shewanella sp. YLB-07]MPY24325.1 helix-turn-helix transcriptional regulator [Shewanella sp. YLB-07]